MILGSHNTLTYSKPRKWYMKLFAWTARCQSKKLVEQYNTGARLFDFRFVFNNEEPIIAHGFMEFDITALQLDYIFMFLDVKSKREICWVRIINEQNKNKDIFIKFCETIKHKYPNIKFYGGRNKKDWRVLYDFGYGEPKVIDKYSSQNNDVFKGKHNGSGWYWDDLWPWLYAKLNNKKWKERYKDQDVYLMQDFI